MSVAANRYARALLEVLFPQEAESGLKQLKDFRAMLADSPDLSRVLENPTVQRDRRNQLLRELSQDAGLSPHVRNFLTTVVENRRIGLIDEIVKAYQHMLDEKLGVVAAVISVAQAIDALEEKAIADKIEQITGKRVRVSVRVDPSLIGGIVASVGSTIYDGSVRQQLHAFRNRLVTS